MIGPTGTIEELIRALLNILAVDAKVFASIAGLGARLLSDEQAQVVWYVTEASTGLQEQIDRLEHTSHGLAKEFHGRLDEGDHAQLVQVGTVQPVTQGNPVSVVTLGARVALDNDPTDGTLGALLKDKSGNRYLLTCRHVLDGAKGARVVLRNVNGDDQWVARLTAVSKWNLVDSGWSNQTDFALAAILDTVIADPQLPIGTPPLAQTPVSGMPMILSPLLDLQRSFAISEIPYALTVNFPYGEVRLSNMWFGKSNSAKPPANFGDSGSLFVTQDRCGTLIPAALAVAMSSEHSDWLAEEHRVRYGVLLQIAEGRQAAA